MTKRLAEIREGARVLCSRSFWEAFRGYWSPKAVASRLDDLAARMRGD